MEKLLIKGGKSLSGQIDCSGAKNAALPVIAASILSSDDITLKNLPYLQDITTMFELIGSMGADISLDEKKNKIVSVKQELLTTNNAYPIIYKLREYKNGTYKIVNIIINGINLGQTFHNQFQALAIEKNENISSIISEWKSDAFIDG